MKIYIRSASYINASDSETEEQRARTAQQTNDPQLLRELATDEAQDVRYYVAENVNVTPDILSQLANDPDAQVRCNVAYNPNTPSDILAQLAKDSNKEVRNCAIKNPNAPSEAKQEALKKKDTKIKRYLKSQMHDYLLDFNIPKNYEADIIDEWYRLIMESNYDAKYYPQYWQHPDLDELWNNGKIDEDLYDELAQDGFPDCLVSEAIKNVTGMDV